MNKVTENFGKLLRYHRKRKKLSQEALAEACELHPVYIGQLERGEKNASLDTIMRICNGLAISPQLLFGEIERTQEQSPAQKAYELFMQTPPEKQHTLLELLQKATELI